MIIRRIVGVSMMPTFKSGRVVMAVKKRFNKGDIVIAKIDGREVIKRVYSKYPTIKLIGDNPLSAIYENVSRDAILGVVIWPKKSL